MAICTTERHHSPFSYPIKREYMRYKLRIMWLKISTSHLGFNKSFSYLLSLANFSSTKFMSAFVSFSNAKSFQYFVLPSSLNRLNTLSPYQMFAEIGNT